MNRLPPELVRRVANHLAPRDLARLASACVHTSDALREETRGVAVADLLVALHDGVGRDWRRPRPKRTVKVIVRGKKYGLTASSYRIVLRSGRKPAFVLDMPRDRWVVRVFPQRIDYKFMHQAVDRLRDAICLFEPKPPIYITKTEHDEIL